MERRDLVGRVHRRELPPRRLPARRSSATSGPQEFLAAARELFDSWSGDEIVADKAVGRLPRRPGRRRASRDHDDQFDIGGQFNVPRSPQGRPVIFQAGDSEEGREFAAATADAIFTRHGTLEAGRAFYADVKGRLAEVRPPPEELEDPAGRHVRARRHRRGGRSEQADVIRRQQVSGQTAIKFLEQLWNRDLSGYDPDGPLPEVDPLVGENTIARGRASVRMHRDPVATARQWRELADGEEPVDPRADHRGDRPADVHRHAGDGGRRRSTSSSRPTRATASSSSRTSPRAGSTSSPTQVVPLLQERGVFRTEYEGTTLRDHLGLRPVPAAREGVRS